MTASKRRVLVVDDDPELARTLAEGLEDLGYEAVAVPSSAEANGRLAEPFDALVTDLRMPGLDGLGLLAASRRVAPERPVIVMTAHGAVDSAIESIRRGAYHYLTKPFKVEELGLFVDRAVDEARLRREAQVLRRTVRESFSFDRVIGSTGGLREVCDLVRRICDAQVPVLVLGETGSGKGVIARALHAHGGRSEKPFVTVSCAAIPENLLESELFGHARGAFTGASTDRRGLLEEADGGTVFLDEIGELPLTLQAKLLDFVERRVVRPVGSNRERAIDTGIIAATHRNLGAQVAVGQFRQDLLFRLDVVSIELPPLRQRKADIPLLAAWFLERARAKHPRAVALKLGKGALDALSTYSWPGNVRELENMMDRVALLGSTSEVTVVDLPASVSESRAASGVEGIAFSGPVRTLVEIERRYAAWALDQMEGRKLATAEKLDVDRKTLAKLLGDG
ncbi:MAG: sigma-54-dependent transcriptional regulator [Polyangiaceae bacterium]